MSVILGRIVVFCKDNHNWASAMQAAPPGWHLPSDEEWKEMEKTLGLTQEQADQEGVRVEKDSSFERKIKRIDACQTGMKENRLSSQMKGVFQP